MAWADKASAYNSARRARLRAEWIAENGPCNYCGTTENLQLDHIDPLTKDIRLQGGSSGNLWGWRPEVRLAELAKCQVLCVTCHKLKTRIAYIKTHCKLGHPLSGDNIAYTGKGGQTLICRICRNATAREAAQRKAAPRKAYKELVRNTRDNPCISFS